MIVLENQEYETVIGSSHMPYYNSLVQQYGLAANFYADTHPSIGNYFMMTVGEIISNSNDFASQVSNDNIAREMCNAGVSWTSYSESLPSVGYLGDRASPYAKTHNPFAYFTDVIYTPQMRQLLVPFTQFLADVANDHLPQFSYIDPNQYHNTHNCPPGTNCNPKVNDDKLAVGDAWLQQIVPLILNNPSFSRNGVLIITFDESWDSDFRSSSTQSTGGGHIPVLIIGPQVKPGFKSTTYYHHGSVLHFVSDLLGISATNQGANAPDMSEFLK